VQAQGPATGTPAAVLVVEDDRALRQAIVTNAERAGYAVTAVADGLAAGEAIRSGRFDVVLLDIGLPFVDGWTILTGMEGRRIPSVIVISARGEERDKVRALDLGADDYLAKPFGADELLARIRAVLRRAQAPASRGPAVEVGKVTVDLASHSVWKNGREVRLSPTEYGLLAMLTKHLGEVIDHRTLLREVWGPGYGDERNYLRTFIQRLRLKLEDDPGKPQLIVTAGTRGYRFGGTTAS
jgi:two-component system, OmpR family, KDP operon response regulator KdpE